MIQRRLTLAAAGIVALLLATPAVAETHDLYVWPYCPPGTNCGYASELEYQLKVKDMIQEMNLQWEVTGLSFRPRIQPIDTTDAQFIAITGCSSDLYWCDDLMTRCDPDNNGCGGPCLQRTVCADMTTECVDDSICQPDNGTCIDINRQRATQWREQKVKTNPDGLHMLSSYGRWKCCSGIPPNDGLGVVPGMLCHSYWNSSAKGMGGLWAHEMAHHYCLSHTFTKQDLATDPPVPNHDGDGLADTQPDPLALEGDDRDPRCLNSPFLQTCATDSDCGSDGPCDQDFVGQDYEFCSLDPLHADVSDDSPHSTWCTTQCKRCTSGPCHLDGSPGTFSSLFEDPNEEVANSYWGMHCRGPFIRNGTPYYAFTQDMRDRIDSCRATYPELGDDLPDVCENLGGDTDHDGICDVQDNCVSDKNTAQRNSDGDNLGDACDPCPHIPFLVIAGPDWDRMGNLCDRDKDNDGCDNDVDQHPDDARIVHGSTTTIGCTIENETTYVHESHDSDGDGVPNCLDLDDDNDNICDEGGPLSQNAATGVPAGGCEPGDVPPGEMDPRDICPTDSTNTCHVVRPGPPCIPLWNICALTTTCEEFFLKITDLINPVPDVIIDQFEIINRTIYATPPLGMTAAELANSVLGAGNFGGAVTEGASSMKRIEIWRRTPEEFVAVVVDDYDASRIEYINDINHGRIVAFIPPDDAGTPLAVGTTYASGVDFALRTPDADGDGRPDWADNCLATANFRQVDSDGDGHGNACDADLDNDGQVTDEDVAAVVACDGADLSIGTPIMEPAEMGGDDVLEPTEAEETLAAACGNADLNDDRVVDRADAAMADAMLGTEPGPSAYVNRAPVADAGFDDSTACGGSVTLDGCASFDPDGDVLTFSWSSSSCVIREPAACATEVSCDQGDNVVTLIVNDATIDSFPDPVAVSVGSCASPGAIPSTMIMRTDPASGRLILEWEDSCLAARNYGVFEGRIGNWYSHVAIACTDGDGVLNSEPIAPASGDRYYLVVPLDEAEGSYGESEPGVERPRAFDVADRCLLAQTLAACP